MESTIYNQILSAKKAGKKLLAVLLDPDKVNLEDIATAIAKIESAKAAYIFVGGSTVALGITEICVQEIKKHTQIPVVLFPGDYSQLTARADAALFLSLVSGNNPEYLIQQHIKSVPFFLKNKLESIATAYVLINGGTHTATQKVSNTEALSQNDVSLITHTCIAAEMQGKKAIYLEAGSGAKIPVAEKIIKSVAKKCFVPLIVGGGIRTKEALENAYKNGADIVVIGTAFEENPDVFENLWTEK